MNRYVLSVSLILVGGLGVGFGVSTGPLVYQSWIDYRHDEQQRVEKAASASALAAERAEAQAKRAELKARLLSDKNKYLTKYAADGEWTWHYGDDWQGPWGDYQLSSMKSSENCTNRLRNGLGTETLSICEGEERNYWRMEKVWTADCETGKKYPTNVGDNIPLKCELRGPDKTKVLSVTLTPDYRVSSERRGGIKPPDFPKANFGGYTWDPSFEDFPYNLLVKQATLMGIQAFPRDTD